MTSNLDCGGGIVRKRHKRAQAARERKILMMRTVAALIAVVVLLGAPPRALGSPASDALRARASDQIYNLDRDQIGRAHV